MLPTIDLLAKSQEIKIQICNSRMQVIGSVKEADSKSYDINTGKLNELSFVIPLYIDNLQTGIQKNKHADLLVNRCILKVKYGTLEEYFRIDNHEDSDDNQFRNIHAFSLGYQLNDKLIKNYKSQVLVNSVLMDAPIDITTAITDALQNNRGWSVGQIDAAFAGMYRYFEFDSQTGLEYIYQIGTAYNAIIVWDTKNKKVSAYHPDLYGTDKGFKISDEKYISNLVKRTSDDEFCTRLYLYGKDGITINSVSPLGQSYIEDFSYFMNNGMMSQELITSLTNYNDYVISRQGEFPSLLTQLNTYQGEMSTLNIDMSTLKNTKQIIQDKLDSISAINERTNISYSLTTDVLSGTTTFTDETPVKRLLFFKLITNENPTISHNGVNVPSTTNKLYMLKLDGDITSTLNLSGFTNPVQVEGYYIIVSDEEFALSITELEDKYGIDKITSLIDSKQTEINAKQTQINSVLTSISQLKNDLAIDNHLVEDDLNELDQFIIEKEYTDDNLLDAEVLLESGKKQLLERNIPQVLYDVSLINFLNCLEEKRNWDKLSIFDIVRIQSKKLDVDIKARIINIKIDNDSIGLTIANSKNVKDEPDKFIQLLYGTVNGTKSLQRKEGTWDDVVNVRTEFNEYLNSAIDATKQQIVAGINETVQITERGIKVTSPTDINTYLIINHGVIAITRDNGITWENALTTKGVIAERVIGKLLIGSNLTISNSNGTFAVDGGNVTINGGSTKAKILINSTDGIKIQTSPDNGTTWVDTFFVDIDGIIKAKGLVILSDDGSAVLIDAKNKTIDFSQFTTVLGKLSADNITIGSGTTYENGYDPSIIGTYIDETGIYTGTINFNQGQGGTLKLGGVDNGNGSLQVLDSDGEIVANLDSTLGGFDKLWAGDFSSPTVPNYNTKNLTFYVDPLGDDSNDGLTVNTAKQTIQAAIDMIPKFNNGRIDIQCKAPATNTRQDYYGMVNINGFVGSGQITIEGVDWYNYINGRILVVGCSNAIYINNFTINFTETSGNAVGVWTSKFVQCTKVWVYGVNKATNAFMAETGSSLFLSQCEGYDVVNVMSSQHLSSIMCDRGKGSGTSYGLIAQWGAWIYVNSTYPSGTTAATYSDSGGGVTLSTATSTGGTTGGTGGVPTAQSTKTIYVNNGDNWSASYGSWQGGGVRQGNYGYGNRTGAWFFGTSILDTIGTGKTIKSMKVWIDRKSTGGSSGAVRHSIHYHTSATKPAGNVSLSAEIASINLGWGSGGWATISSTYWSLFANGTAKGIAVYTADGSNYSILSTEIWLEITYQ